MNRKFYSDLRKLALAAQQREIEKVIMETWKGRLILTTCDDSDRPHICQPTSDNDVHAPSS